MQRNDCVLTALGSGEYNELLHAYYVTNGATSDQINDAEYEFLIARGVSPAAIPDMWEKFLIAQGYTGSLTDMLYDFWCVGGGVFV